MKIRSIRAVEVRGLHRLRDLADTGAGAVRPSWMRTGPVAGPLTRYPRFAANRRSWTPDWPPVGCLVEAEDGSWGVALADHGPPVAAVIDDYLGPRLRGEEVLATEKVYDLAVRMCAPLGATGLAMYAVSAVDLALWDLKGKLLDRPVYQLLGGPARDQVTCYATGADLDWYRELGFPAVKLPCRYGPADGADGLRGNLEAVAKAREQVGDDVDLMLDCWMGFEVESAVRLATELRRYRLRWLEECLPPEDLDAHAQLRRRLPEQTLATGEHWYHPATFLHAARHQLVDVLQPDIQWVGGLTALLRICAIAEAAGIPVVPHAGGLTAYGQHACLALPAIGWAEFLVATPPGAPLRAGYGLPGVPTPVGGRLRPASDPGFGQGIERDQLRPVTGEAG